MMHTFRICALVALNLLTFTIFGFPNPHLSHELSTFQDGSVYTTENLSTSTVASVPAVRKPRIESIQDALNVTAADILATDVMDLSVLAESDHTLEMDSFMPRLVLFDRQMPPTGPILQPPAVPPGTVDPYAPPGAPVGFDHISKWYSRGCIYVRQLAMDSSAFYEAGQYPRYAILST